MKLKYEKIILLVTVCAMGIGMITFSMSGPRSDGNKLNDSVSSNQKALSIEDDQKTTLKIADGLTDDGTLQENAYPEINALVKKYLDARVNCDMKAIKETVSSTSTITEESLQKELEYIEGYDNLSCYTIKAPDGKSFVVYVYEELKIIGIDTLAPGMTRLYVKLDETGRPVIYFGQVDDVTSDFIEASSKTEKVAKLIDTVNKKMDEAMTKDKNIKAFVAGLEQSAK